jgi:hypothetical protein
MLIRDAEQAQGLRTIGKKNDKLRCPGDAAQRQPQVSGQVAGNHQ